MRGRNGYTSGTLRTHKENGNAEMVLSLLQAGCSYSDIAVQLKMSRNTIAGIVSRHLSRVKPGRQGRQRTHDHGAILKLHAEDPDRSYREIATACGCALNTVARVLGAARVKTAPAPVPWTPRKCSLPEPENLKVELIDLGPQMCKYPNAVDPPPYEFCGQPTVYGPYCPYHSAIVWTTGAPARTQVPDASHTSAS